MVCSNLYVYATQCRSNSQIILTGQRSLHEVKRELTFARDLKILRVS